MPKKPNRKRAPKNRRPPETIGDVRKLLAELGNPWRPNPSLSHEPIPAFPTGGDDTISAPGRLLPQRRVLDFIKTVPPSNPFLRAAWKKQARLDGRDRARAVSDAHRLPISVVSALGSRRCRRTRSSIGRAVHRRLRTR